MSLSLLSPLSPALSKGFPFSPAVASSSSAEPGWLLALTLQGEGAKQGLGAAGKAQGHSCEQGTGKVELCPGGTAAGIVRGTGMWAAGDWHRKALPPLHTQLQGIITELVTGFPKKPNSSFDHRLNPF